MLEIARNYPFLVPFLLMTIPFAFVLLAGCWLLVLARKGKCVNIAVKGLGIEIAMNTTLNTEGN